VSKELLAKKERIIQELKDEWPEELGEFHLAEITTEAEADFIMVYIPDVGPIGMLAWSDRAKALCEQWGVPPDVLVAAPENPLDFINSVPLDWTMAVEAPEQGAFAMMEVPLPKPRLVLH
jgi:hypothetical protein